MTFLLSALAVWKLSVMLMDYNGPLDIIKIPRDFIDKLQKRHDRELLSFDCFFCFSTVVSIPFAVYIANGWESVGYWLAISAVAYFLNLVAEKLE